LFQLAITSADAFGRSRYTIALRSTAIATASAAVSQHIEIRIQAKLRSPMTSFETTLTLIGGPTVLIELAGFRLLTDPTFDAPGRYHRGVVTQVKITGPALRRNSCGQGFRWLTRVQGRLAHGDLITELDGTPIKGLALNEVVEKMRGAAGTKLRVVIQRIGLDRPLELVIVRDVIPVPGVELRVRLETGKLMIESAGLWPILDFEKGQPVAVAAISTTEFYVADVDHTRIAFVRDAGGKVSGAILNPGPRQQTGVRLD
jgi:hypothetical protein